jgi:IS5 family transposase
VATQVLPPYRTRFSKHQFTQPQLLAVLCLMRYEDWTFREAEVRLREHQELRAALHLPAVPDYTTLYRFLRRLEDDTVDRGLQETVRRLRRRRSRPVSAAIDGTGLSDTSVSTFFLRRLEQHAHGTRPRRPWLKWLIVVDVQQQILLAQRARQGPGCDARALPGLLDVAARGAPLGVVLADAEFDSEANHQHIRQRLGAKSIIPARRRGVPNGTIRNQMFRAFPKKPYRQRNKIESIFSAVKRKLSSRAPGRSLATQIRQALLLGLAYNLYRLRHRTAHRGCQQSPTLAGISISVASKGVRGGMISQRSVERVPTRSGSPVGTSSDRPGHAERIRCSCEAGECAAVEPIVGLGLFGEPGPETTDRVTGRGCGNRSFGGRNCGWPGARRRCRRR